MDALFETMKIKGMELRNRFVRSATYDGRADRNGNVTEQQIRLFENLAHGGVGLIVSGIAYVHPSGQISPIQNSIADDACIPGFKKMIDAVHKQGAKIAVQLFHAGRERARVYRSKNKEAVAPSFIENDPYFKEHYRPMTEDEIREVIRAFGDAAKRAREAGFDAIQVHGAHAYLLSQFLSPYANRRSDDWGGTLEERLRFHREIYREIREKAGEDYPVFIKIGVQDGFAGGLEFREGKKAARLMAEWGFDALEISSGLRGKYYEETEFRTRINRIEHEGYFREWCQQIKDEVNVPVMMVGGLRTPEVMAEVIQKGEADLVSLCRPLIREPGIINEWKNGNYHRSACISCNKCYEALVNGEPLHCVVQKNEEA